MHHMSLRFTYILTHLYTVF